MIIDATFWVAISFLIFVILLVYFKIPSKVKNIIDENKNEFDTASSVSLGAHKWLTLHRFNTPGEDNVKACFDALHAKGYKILATSPHENDTDIHQVAVNEKVALVFGTELDGISDNVKALADGFVKIPMFGFSESFNISVSAAICIYELTTRLRDADIDWRLEKGYKQELLCDWTKKSIKAGDRLEEKYYKEIKKPE